MGYLLGGKPFRVPPPLVGERSGPSGAEPEKAGAGYWSFGFNTPLLAVLLGH